MPDRNAATLFAEDDAARARALDTAGSFLVQAPAGSGKTELLIQRYLSLLGKVETPERIVALTFTRKAAGEMRERVLEALVEARDRVPVEGSHACQTRNLADAVLTQDARQGWNLIEHTSRLQLLTFDALAAWLARRAPLAAGLGPKPAYVDDASVLHRAAAHAAIAAASAKDVHWRTLLVHLDNNADRAATLIADLLAKRDQWLRQVEGEDAAALRAQMEAALRIEVAQALAATRNAFPPGIGATIAACARYAASVLGEIGEAHDFGDVLASGAEGLPAASVEALPQWNALARFLMVDDCSHFKRRIDVNDGFPPAGKDAGAGARRARKEAMTSLCAELDAIPGLASALAAASRLPPTRMSDASWQVVEALLHVLRLAAGHLKVVFGEAGKVDFVQAKLSALDALGRPDDPTDLLLRLDARIDHLLIDEFQDTSIAELDLVVCLTAGWQPGNGRTLFAVGDPAQSIYRFREAEVRLFVKAQQDCMIAGLPVEPLRLSRNFRSQAHLVAWVNAVFPQVLGRISDAARGAVAFAPSAPYRDPRPSVIPTLDLCRSGEDEAYAVVARIREAQAAGESDIAVLVRARRHLALLLPALRRADVPFAAVELDLLSQRQAVLDLIALTHALLQPADRAAWIAVLRAPWCGLMLGDVFALVEAADRDGRSLAAVLDDRASLALLDGDARTRLERTMAVLSPALAARGRATVAARVRGAWLALGGPACLDDPLDLETAEWFFAVLAAQEQGGDVADWDAFRAALDELFASPEAAAAAGVKVMTMHKAKGLEFDTVILPGLGQAGPGDDAPLLRWRRRDTGLLIAPGKARGGDRDPLYAHLGDLDAQEQDAELGRLLYVACTRAKTRLHLIAVPGIHEAKSGTMSWKPAKSSSLAKLWPALEAGQPTPSTREAPADTGAFEPIALTRLPLGWSVEPPDTGLDTLPAASRIEVEIPSFEWAAETARWIGTLAHRLLARIAAEGLDTWTPQRVATLEPRVRASLASVGFTGDELRDAAAKVLDAVRRTLVDPRGRWLFDATHEEARSEWALAGVDDGEIVRVVVDRTFVAGGERWIVDFKTGTHEGGDVAGFLDSEAMRYRDQLVRYGRLMQGLDKRPVRLALYYPLIDRGFVEVGPSSGRLIL